VAAALALWAAGIVAVQGVRIYEVLYLDYRERVAETEVLAFFHTTPLVVAVATVLGASAIARMVRDSLASSRLVSRTVTFAVLSVASTLIGVAMIEGELGDGLGLLVVGGLYLLASAVIADAVVATTRAIDPTHMPAAIARRAAA
jgi:hypothetical protein